MRITTLGYRNAARNGGRAYIKACLIFSDSTQMWLDDGDFIEESVSFTDGTSSSGSFDIGGAVIGSFNFILNNYEDKFTGKDFTNAKIIPYVGLYPPSELEYVFCTEDGIHELGTNDRLDALASEDAVSTVSDQIEWLQFGVYYFVTHKTTGHMISATCYDAMLLFDRSEFDELPAAPTTVFQIVSAIADKYDIDLAVQSFPNSTTVISMYSGETMTDRQALAYLVQMCGCYAKMTNTGTLYIGWYDTLTPRYYDRLFVQNLHTNDIVVTGLHVYYDDNNYILAGTEDGYVLKVQGNPFITSANVTAVSALIAANVIGMVFRAGSIGVISDPTVESGDVLQFLDIKGNRVTTIVTCTEYKPYNVQETLTCSAEEEEKDDFRPTVVEIAKQRADEHADAVAEEASKVAVNYMASDETGIMVADLANGRQTPSTATGRNVFIDNDSVDIRNGQTVLGSFGEVTTIGEDGKSQLQLSAAGMNGVGQYGQQTFNISGDGAIDSVAKRTGYIHSGISTSAVQYEIDPDIASECVSGSEVNVSITLYNSTATDFMPLRFTAFSYGTAAGPVTATAYGVTASVSYDGADTFILSWSASGSNRYDITIDCITNAKTPVYTFGYNSGDDARGAYSFTIGRDNIALGEYSFAQGTGNDVSDYAAAFGENNVVEGANAYAFGRGLHIYDLDQVAIGHYNDPAAFSGYLFVIGNGASDSNRSNAFTVDAGGTVVASDYKVKGTGSTRYGVWHSGNLHMSDLVDTVYTESAASYTYSKTLTSGSAYLLIITKLNATTATYHGVYLISAHSSNTAIVPLAAATGSASVSASGTSLTVNVSTSYVKIDLIKLH